MSTQVKVIIGQNKVYATYYKTICFTEDFKVPFFEDESNDDNCEKIRCAKAAAFNVACGFGSVLLEVVKFEKVLTDDDVFAYLEKSH